MNANEITKRFTLDGQPVDLDEFLADNLETISPEDCDAIDRLDVGGAITFGGGAGAEFVLKRIA